MFIAVQNDETVGAVVTTSGRAFNARAATAVLEMHGHPVSHGTTWTTNSVVPATLLLPVHFAVSPVLYFVIIRHKWSTYF